MNLTNFFLSATTAAVSTDYRSRKKQIWVVAPREYDCAAAELTRRRYHKLEVSARSIIIRRGRAVCVARGEASHGLGHSRRQASSSTVLWSTTSPAAAIAQSSPELIRILHSFFSSVSVLNLCSANQCQIFALHISVHNFFLFSLSLRPTDTAINTENNRQQVSAAFLFTRPVRLWCVPLCLSYVLPGTDAKCGPPLAVSGFYSFLSVSATSW